MRFPLGDWQFWVATACAVLIVGRAIWVNVRKRKPGVSATLTVKGEPARDRQA